MLVIRDGSAFLIGGTEQEAVASGDVLPLGSSAPYGAESEGHVTATAIYEPHEV
ncbi:hypothetical protein CZ771_08690 [Actinomycetales bacterium JB111]|nr:hypothetical protein CZ771_08690 [Actinomycetales bacterium JB111]